MIRFPIPCEKRATDVRRYGPAKNDSFAAQNVCESAQNLCESAHSPHVLNPYLCRRNPTDYGETGKILIVDDNQDILFALNLLLAPRAEKVKVATSPDRIPQFMKSFGPDLVLLDMNFRRDAISGEEGFENLKGILELDPTAVVVMMTAYADTEKAVRAIKMGAADFIPKP